MATRKKLQVKRQHGKLAKKCKLARPAALTDHEVELVRKLHEAHPRGHPEHMGYAVLALKFEVSKTTIRQYCRYQRR
jgi:hypothetical protein